MNPLLAFQLRRIGRNRQYLIFTVLLPALFTVFFTEIFGGLATTPAGYQREAVQYMVSMWPTGPSAPPSAPPSGSPSTVPRGGSASCG